MMKDRNGQSIAGRAAGRLFAAALSGLDDFAARAVRTRRVGLSLLLGTLLTACAGSPPPPGVGGSPAPPAAVWDTPGGVWDAPTARWGP